MIDRRPRHLVCCRTLPMSILSAGLWNGWFPSTHAGGGEGGCCLFSPRVRDRSRRTAVWSSYRGTRIGTRHKTSIIWSGDLYSARCLSIFQRVTITRWGSVSRVAVSTSTSVTIHCCGIICLPLWAATSCWVHTLPSRPLFFSSLLLSLALSGATAVCSYSSSCLNSCSTSRGTCFPLFQATGQPDVHSKPGHFYYYCCCGSVCAELTVQQRGAFSSLWRSSIISSGVDAIIHHGYQQQGVSLFSQATRNKCLPGCADVNDERHTL